MRHVESYGLLGARKAPEKTTRTVDVLGDLVAERRLAKWRREQLTISDRDRPVPPRLPAPVRRSAAKARMLPVLGLREYRRAGGKFTIESESC